MGNNNFSRYRQARDWIYLFSAYCCIFLYIPHIIIYIFKKRKIIEDIRINKNLWNVCFGDFNSFLYLFHSNRYFRSLYYYRVGIILRFLTSWIRPGCRDFVISPTTIIGKGLCLVHPYATTINANSVGDNFKINCCTTIGSKKAI